jgi:hypothetical protein
VACLVFISSDALFHKYICHVVTKINKELTSVLGCVRFSVKMAISWNLVLTHYVYGYKIDLIKENEKNPYSPF